MTKEKIKNIALTVLSCLLIGLCATGAETVVAKANDDYVEGDGTINGNGVVIDSSSESMDITLTVSSDYSVRIPKVLDITEKNPSYTLVISGTIEEGHVLQVKPEEYIEFMSTGGDLFNAPVTQEKTVWTHEELEATGECVAKGYFDITGITSGIWSGSLYFDISLIEVIGD